jgi:hypothetical protein
MNYGNGRFVQDYILIVVSSLFVYGKGVICHVISENWMYNRHVIFKICVNCSVLELNGMKIMTFCDVI